MWTYSIDPEVEVASETTADRMSPSAGHYLKMGRRVEKVGVGEGLCESKLRVEGSLVSVLCH